MAKTWADFDEEVIPHVPGCPLAVARQAVKRAAIQFFRESHVWRSKAVTPLNVVAAQQDYTFGTGATAGTLAANTAVVRVFDLWYDDVKLEALTPDEFKAQSDWDSEAGTPETFTSFARGSVSLWPIPETSVAAILDPKEVSLAPTQSATGVEDLYFEDHMEAIAKGARARLFLMAKSFPWVDRALGMELKSEFASYIGSIQAAAARGHNGGKSRVATRYRS